MDGGYVVAAVLGAGGGALLRQSEVNRLKRELGEAEAWVDSLTLQLDTERFRCQAQSAMQNGVIRRKDQLLAEKDAEIARLRELVPLELPEGPERPPEAK
jgi:hypothetical protein